MLSEESRMGEYAAAFVDLPMDHAASAVDPSFATSMRPELRVNETEVAARNVLGNCPYPALRGIQCEFHDGTMTLSGEVPSFYLKQVAQTLLRGIHPIHCIVNNVRVC